LHLIDAVDVVGFGDANELGLGRVREELRHGGPGALDDFVLLAEVRVLHADLDLILVSEAGLHVDVDETHDRVMDGSAAGGSAGRARFFAGFLAGVAAAFGIEALGFEAAGATDGAGRAFADAADAAAARDRTAAAGHQGREAEPLHAALGSALGILGKLAVRVEHVV